MQTPQDVMDWFQVLAFATLSAIWSSNVCKDADRRAGSADDPPVPHATEAFPAQEMLPKKLIIPIDANKIRGWRDILVLFT